MPSDITEFKNDAELLISDSVIQSGSRSTTEHAQSVSVAVLQRATVCLSMTYGSLAAHAVCSRHQRKPKYDEYLLCKE